MHEAVARGADVVEHQWRHGARVDAVDLQPRSSSAKLAPPGAEPISRAVSPAGRDQARPADGLLDLGPGPGRRRGGDRSRGARLPARAVVRSWRCQPTKSASACSLGAVITSRTRSPLRLRSRRETVGAAARRARSSARARPPAMAGSRSSAGRSGSRSKTCRRRGRGPAAGQRQHRGGVVGPPQGAAAGPRERARRGWSAARRVDLEVVNPGARKRKAQVRPPRGELALHPVRRRPVGEGTRGTAGQPRCGRVFYPFPPPTARTASEFGYGRDALWWAKSGSGFWNNQHETSLPRFRRPALAGADAAAAPAPRGCGARGSEFLRGARRERRRRGQPGGALAHHQQGGQHGGTGQRHPRARRHLPRGDHGRQIRLRQGWLPDHPEFSRRTRHRRRHRSADPRR